MTALEFASCCLPIDASLASGGYRGARTQHDKHEERLTIAHGLSSSMICGRGRCMRVMASPQMQGLDPRLAGRPAGRRRASGRPCGGSARGRAGR